MSHALSSKRRKQQRFGQLLAAVAPRFGSGLLIGPTRILVLRCDPRVGNVVMLLPLLQALKQRFPKARIELCGDHRLLSLFAGEASVDHYIEYDKKSWLNSRGPLGLIWTLLSRRYDVVLDATNPDEPSFTQGLFSRLARTSMAVGFNSAPWKRFYHHAVPAGGAQTHEIKRRGALLRPLGIESPSLYPRFEQNFGAPSAWSLPKDFVVLNIGARLGIKQLSEQTYTALAETMSQGRADVLLSYGPSEYTLAKNIADAVPQTRLAPETSLIELCALFSLASAVVSCDTGPMHLAVAVQTKTLGIFVETSAQRFGYTSPPHQTVSYSVGNEACLLRSAALFLDS